MCPWTELSGEESRAESRGELRSRALQGQYSVSSIYLMIQIFVNIKHEFTDKYAS